MSVQQHILLFGAGKSATVLIDYLKKAVAENNWLLTVADYDVAAALAKTNNAPNTVAVQVTVVDETSRKKLINAADIVISMLPPALHYLVAADCVELNKNLLTASYVDDNIKALQKDIEAKGLLFLCEMGLDPGIDHMSAMQMMDAVHKKGGTITSFKSHCGGLVAPESDDNPWHYKISWNPANIVAAGKAGAEYRMNGNHIRLRYEEIFARPHIVDVPGLGNYGYYPNRDSLAYIDLYKLPHINTFVRTTLRHPDFFYGWNNIVRLGLTSAADVYDTDGLSIADFFNQHLQQHNFLQWQKEILQANDKQAIILQQFLHLGINDDKTLINKGKCTAAQVLQYILEKKLVLQPQDKDMIIMMHELEYELNGAIHQTKSWLVLKGDDALRTAMAKTVGLPLGIAATLILEKKISITGLHIPVAAEIYTPVLKELTLNGIAFKELHS